MRATIQIDRRGLLASGVALAGLASAPAFARDAKDIGVTARVAAGTESTPLVHFWSKCVGAGRANEGLRAAWLEQLRTVHDTCGFQYCRFHGLFHDDMFVARRVDGKIAYNWQYIDELFDRMLAIGVKPFVELGFMPAALASTEKTQFWWKGNVSPPRDYSEWGALVDAFARHCLERYGEQEVRSWYFEVWNEPNLRGFWDGTRAQYFELYKTSVLALKAVDPALRVGGPATSNFVGDDRFEGEIEDKSKQRTNQVADINRLPWRGVWIEAFLAYCAEQKLPVDFISCHPYPTDFALDPGIGRNRGRTRKVNATRDDLTWLRKTVIASPYPNAEIHLTEWSSSPSSADATHDTIQAATFIIKANLDSIGLVNSLSYWVFTDIFEEAGGGPSAFHGGFGLITMQGVKKPAFHAYRMLNSLGDEIVHRQDGLIVTRDSSSGKHVALAYHFPAEVKDSLSFGDRASAQVITDAGAPCDFSLRFDGLSPNAIFEIETLDQSHGNALAAWDAIGRPNSPTPTQAARLRAEGEATDKCAIQAGADGILLWRQRLTPWSCVLLRET